MTLRKQLPLVVNPILRLSSSLQICARCKSAMGTKMLEAHTPKIYYGIPRLIDSTRLNHHDAGDSTIVKRDGPPWRVMFFGSDNFSIASLKALHKCRTEGKLIEKLHVVCPETKYIKRKGKTRIISPIWQYCHDNDLTHFPWPITPEVKGYDIGVLSSFGHLVPGHLIESFPYGIANVHPSLLPRWRGASPITSAILGGDKTTGVSIMGLRPKRFDVGPILLQESIETPHRCTTESLQETLASQGADMIVRFLKDLPTFHANGKAQSEEGVTLCRKIVPKMAIVSWSKMCDEIDRLYRAIGQDFPLETSWNGNQVRLNQMNDPKVTADLEINMEGALLGELYYHKPTQQLCVKCKDGWASFGEVTFRKKMTAKDFYNGFLSGKNIGRQCFV
ncbi:methionyl-tRNA formyltransferase, mitochondrial-like [Asterias amurensis]|uniref:methionyl-tRNA formyltransferase, mitochondrial-like n=1 Tax=Asterias amurensis TaxID=7602 RepID=UPI003AB35DC2